MSNRTSASFAMVALLLFGGCTFSSIEPNPDHCVNNDGNDYCSTRGYGLMYCSVGTLDCPGHDSPQGDGCVASRPVNSCYSPCGGGPMSSLGGDQGCGSTVTSNGDEDVAGGVSSLSGVETLGSGGWESGTTLGGAGDAGSDDASGSTGATDGQEPVLPPCGENEYCPEPYVCYGQGLPDYSLCTETCHDLNCPVVEEVAMSCSWIPLAFDPLASPLCVFDCSDDEDCPTGMDCHRVGIPGIPGVWDGFEVGRCLWPQAG